MSKYVFNGYIVEAERHESLATELALQIITEDGNDLNWSFAGKMMRYDREKKKLFVNVDTRFGIVRCYYGDWILTGPMGNQWVLDNVVFNKFYRELQEQDEDIKVGSG